MESCQNTIAAKFALPENAMPVRDRALTFRIQCTEQASYSPTLTGLGAGKSRAGAASQMFFLCENHSQLFVQIDKELVQDGWAPTAHDKPVPLF